MPARTAEHRGLTTDTLQRDRRACDYLAAAMIHLKDNVLLTEPLRAEYDPRLALDGHGLAELVRRFSWPGGFPSHLSPEVPGVIQAYGEIRAQFKLEQGLASGSCAPFGTHRTFANEAENALSV